MGDSETSVVNDNPWQASRENEADRLRFAAAKAEALRRVRTGGIVGALWGCLLLGTASLQRAGAAGVCPFYWNAGAGAAALLLSIGATTRSRTTTALLGFLGLGEIGALAFAVVGVMVDGDWISHLLAVTRVGVLPFSLYVFAQAYGGAFDYQLLRRGDFPAQWREITPVVVLKTLTVCGCGVLLLTGLVYLKGEILRGFSEPGSRLTHEAKLVTTRNELLESLKSLDVKPFQEVERDDETERDDEGVDETVDPAQTPAPTLRSDEQDLEQPAEGADAGAATSPDEPGSRADAAVDRHAALPLEAATGDVAVQPGGGAATKESYREAAEQGDADAQNNLGLMYANGRGVPKDDVEAVKWFRKAAEQGHADARNNLGFMYANGRGVPKDDGMAVNWYRKAAEQGHAGAQKNLGFMYANGRGVPKDDVLAVAWYRKAAEQNNADAQNSLGFMYANGRGVPKDDVVAVDWYRKAAEQRNVNAQNNLGFMYANGRGVPKDDVVAVDWYRKAAEQGLAAAQVNLGMRYANGRGVASNYTEAAWWFRRAAAQGDAAGQMRLGAAYSKGLGVPQDYVQAHKWFSLSAAQGAVEAMALRDQTAALMTRDQVAQAQKLTQRWRRTASRDDVSADGPGR